MKTKRSAGAKKWCPVKKYAEMQNQDQKNSKPLSQQASEKNPVSDFTELESSEPEIQCQKSSATYQVGS